jgi:glutaminyl-peptide cyclotransferase
MIRIVRLYLVIATVVGFPLIQPMLLTRNSVTLKVKPNRENTRKRLLMIQPNNTTSSTVSKRHSNDTNSSLSQRMGGNTFLFSLKRTIRCLFCISTTVIIGMVIVIFLEFSLMNQSQGLLPSHNSMIPGNFRWFWTTTIFVPPIDLDGPIYTRVGTFELLDQVPHDTQAFTQGLVTVGTKTRDDHTDKNKDGPSIGGDNNVALEMYEGTGNYGSSQLRRLDIQTGQVLERRKLKKGYFGEGIAHYRDMDGLLRLVQLTWKERKGFEYIVNDKTQIEQPNSQTRSNDELKLVGSWNFKTTTMEGWGITYSPSDRVFYVSDGSEYLHIWNADSKTEERRIAVWYRHTGKGHATTVFNLNELEWDPATNTILANVWYEDLILRINPTTGFVEAMYDLQTLFPKSQRSWGTDVLNGIALTYDWSMRESIHGANVNTDEIWVTGKYWPNMYRIRLLYNDDVNTEIYWQNPMSANDIGE